MIDRLSPRARQVAALVLLSAAIAAVGVLLYLPFALVGHERRELARIDQRIAEVRARLPLRDRLLAEERELEGSMDLDRVLLRAPTPGVAAAQLQGDLSALAVELDVAVSSVQILEPTPEPPFIRIGLRLSTSASTGALRDFLHAIETRTPALVVDSFGLTTPETLAGPDEVPLLTAVIELHGWLREDDPVAQAALPAAPP